MSLPASFARLRLAALNIDGVLLNDTFSPVIHRFITGNGGRYSADLERSVFSQPQHIAGRNMAAALPGGLTGEEALAAYFEERDVYLAEHPVVLTPGAIALVERLRALGLRTVCYGGLGVEHFERFLGEWAELFDGPGYVCTNDFRPGLHEITTEVFGVAYDQAVFVDDVARVAESAKELGVGFIGHPTDFAHSHQPQLMREAGVRHVVGTLDAIDEELLRVVDGELERGTFWTEPESAAASA
ncbi:HAD family phosphatase [Streptomyces misionensis]|uniref:HAD family phosphatase n=1 Tax=Streptomyces misionensis TaxID=67331 RepID=A0A5C6K7M3_9ACTN|nr:HAD family phosphatase [Streptomyces misionensis]TWV58414.1 HAD family phosphatase [Streptomyces misionensis]